MLLPKQFRETRMTSSENGSAINAWFAHSYAEQIEPEKTYACKRTRFVQVVHAEGQEANYAQLTSVGRTCAVRRNFCSRKYLHITRNFTHCICTYILYHHVRQCTSFDDQIIILLAFPSEKPYSNYCSTRIQSATKSRLYS